MIRKLLAITAATAALTVGTAGVAAADTPSFHDPSVHPCDTIGGGSWQCLVTKALALLSTGSATNGYDR